MSDTNVWIFNAIIGGWFLAMIWAIATRRPASRTPYREGIKPVDNVRRML